MKGDLYGRAEETTWPVPFHLDDTDSPGWRMRYGPHPDRFVASIVEAYFVLVDPNVSTTSAIDKLRTARKAVASVLPQPEAHTTKGVQR